jgi:putative glutamine amidotransferase
MSLFMAINQRRPVIGVTGPIRRGRTIRAFTQFAIRRAGGRFVGLFPGRSIDTRRLDGLIVAGGADVDPGLYGQSSISARNVDPPRDLLETRLIRWALAERKPLLGICRGMHLLNVVLGGTLYQEAATAFPDFKPTAGVFRQATLRRPVHVTRHGWVSSLLGMGRKVHLVNSLHHQAIAELAADLEAVAVDEHGMIQAIELKRKDQFVVGLQWHPELMPYSRVQMSFFRLLVAACRGYRL